MALDKFEPVAIKLPSSMSNPYEEIALKRDVSTPLDGANGRGIDDTEDHDDDAEGLVSASDIYLQTSPEAEKEMQNPYHIDVLGTSPSPIVKT